MFVYTALLFHQSPRYGRLCAIEQPNFIALCSSTIRCRSRMWMLAHNCHAILTRMRLHIHSWDAAVYSYAITLTNMVSISMYDHNSVTHMDLDTSSISCCSSHNESKTWSFPSALERFAVEIECARKCLRSLSRNVFACQPLSEFIRSVRSFTQADAVMSLCACRRTILTARCTAVQRSYRTICGENSRSTIAHSMQKHNHLLHRSSGD